MQNAQDSSLAMAPHSFCMKTLGPHLAARTAMVHTSINLEIKSHSAMLSCRSEDVKVLPLQLGHWKVKITSFLRFLHISHRHGKSKIENPVIQLTQQVYLVILFIKAKI